MTGPLYLSMAHFCPTTNWLSNEVQLASQIKQKRCNNAADQKKKKKNSSVNH